jgi:hypothetical protein
LRADAAAGDGQECGQRPGVGLRIAHADDALAAMRAQHEPAFDGRREHRNRFGLLQHGRGNRLVGRVHDFFEHSGGVLDAIGLLLLCAKRRDDNQERKDDGESIAASKMCHDIPIID